MQEIKTTEVNSSTIKAMGYDFERRLMQIDFWNGSKYQYEPITFESYHNLRNAKSIGKHFNQYFKDNKTITCTKIKNKD